MGDGLKRRPLNGRLSRDVNDEAARAAFIPDRGSSSGSTHRGCPALYVTPRDSGDGICVIRLLDLLSAFRATGRFLKLFVSQDLAHALRFTQRFMNVFVG
jgi:hypothetical protein